MALTDRLLPQDSQAMKKIRFSFVSSVSSDLQVLQVTYSTVGDEIWLLREFGWRERWVCSYRCTVLGRFRLAFVGNDL
jgi:hypothetical protein